MIHSLDGGGAERVMAGLASRLAQRCHEVTLITLDDNHSDRHEVDDRVERIGLDVMSTPGRRIGLAKRLWRLRRTTLGGRFDAVLAFCDATNLLLLMATWGAYQKPPIVISERSDPAFQSLGRIKEWLRTRLYRKADTVVCLSDDVANTLQNRLGRDIQVIPSAVESVPNRVTAANRSVDGALRIIGVGRLEHEKGFDRLLNSLALLTNECRIPDWQLTLCGDGSELESLRELAKDLGINQKVTFTGWVSPLWSQYHQGDLFVLPSRYEGFPSAMLEAMASELAVVAVDAGGGVRDAIRHQENGFLVENNDQALIDGIRELATNPILRGCLASAAGEVSEIFSWEKMVDQYEQLLCSHLP